MAPRLTRTLDPEHRPAAARRWHLVSPDDMDVIRKGLSLAVAGRLRTLTPDELTALQVAAMRADLAAADGAATLETLVIRERRRR